MTKRASFYLCAALAAAAIAACDAKATEDAPATAEPTASEAPSAEPQASAEPEPSAEKSAEPAPSAVQSGDKDKLARALDTVASKPVAGYSQWSGIAAAGAAKARAGDIEGAKESCKKCHALYQEKYKQTMRNAPW